MAAPCFSPLLKLDKVDGLRYQKMREVKENDRSQAAEIKMDRFP